MTSSIVAHIKTHLRVAPCNVYGQVEQAPHSDKPRGWKDEKMWIVKISEIIFFYSSIPYNQPPLSLYKKVLWFEKWMLETWIKWQNMDTWKKWQLNNTDRKWQQNHTEGSGNKITPEENGNSNKNSIRASSNREKRPQRLQPRSPAEEQKVETAMKNIFFKCKFKYSRIQNPKHFVKWC